MRQASAGTVEIFYRDSKGKMVRTPITSMRVIDPETNQEVSLVKVLVEN